MNHAIPIYIYIDAINFFDILTPERTERESSVFLRRHGIFGSWRTGGGWRTGFDGSGSLG
jgi:hypothetical protein